MFGSKNFSENYYPNNSQSSYESSYLRNLRESNHIQQYNSYPVPNLNDSNSQHIIISPSPLIFSQFTNSEKNLSGEKKTTQSSFSTNFTTKYIGYSQLENTFIENIKNYPNQVNDYLTKKDGNKNIKNLLDSINNTSIITCQNMKKINETYTNKITNSNCVVPKIFEIFSKINDLLKVIDNELMNQFSLLTSFNGYDESVQNDEKENLDKIQKVINECIELLNNKIMEVNNNTMNLNNDLNINCQQLKNIMGQEIQKLSENLSEFVKFKNEKNKAYKEYKFILDNIANNINSLQNKFIFLNSKCNDATNNVMIAEKENINNNNTNEKNIFDFNIDKTNSQNIDENTSTLYKKATMKIISEMHKRNKKRKNMKKYK